VSRRNYASARYIVVILWKGEGSLSVPDTKASHSARNDPRHMVQIQKLQMTAIAISIRTLCWPVTILAVPLAPERVNSLSESSSESERGAVSAGGAAQGGSQSEVLVGSPREEPPPSVSSEHLIEEDSRSDGEGTDEPAFYGDKILDGTGRTLFDRDGLVLGTIHRKYEYNASSQFPVFPRGAPC